MNLRNLIFAVAKLPIMSNIKKIATRSRRSLGVGGWAMAEFRFASLCLSLAAITLPAVAMEQQRPTQKRNQSQSTVSQNRVGKRSKNWNPLLDIDSEIGESVFVLPNENLGQAPLIPTTQSLVQEDIADHTDEDSDQNSVLQPNTIQIQASPTLSALAAQNMCTNYNELVQTNEMLKNNLILLASQYNQLLALARQQQESIAQVEKEKAQPEISENNEFQSPAPQTASIADLNKNSVVSQSIESQDIPMGTMDENDLMPQVEKPSDELIEVEPVIQLPRIALEPSIPVPSEKHLDLGPVQEIPTRIEHAGPRYMQPYGNGLVIVGDQQTIIFDDINDLKTRRVINPQLFKCKSSLCGNYLGMGSWRKILVYDLRTAEQILEVDHNEDNCDTETFCICGDAIICQKKKTLKKCNSHSADIENSDSSDESEASDKSLVQSDPDLEIDLVLEDEIELICFDIHTANTLATIKTGVTCISKLITLSDNQFILISDRDNCIKIYDFKENRWIRKISTGYHKPIKAQLKGLTLITENSEQRDGNPFAWDLDNQKFIKRNYIKMRNYALVNEEAFGVLSAQPLGRVMQPANARFIDDSGLMKISLVDSENNLIDGYGDIKASASKSLICYHPIHKALFVLPINDGNVQFKKILRIPVIEKEIEEIS